MPEIEFTINKDTGKMEMKVDGVQGPACADVAKLATDLLGTPRREENTREFYAQTQSTRLIQNKKRN